MNLLITKAIKTNHSLLNENQANNWSIVANLSLTVEETLLIDYLKIENSITEVNNILNNETNILPINLSIPYCYSSINEDNNELTFEIFCRNSKDLKRKYIFIFNVDKNNIFTLKKHYLHLLQ